MIFCGGDALYSYFWGIAFSKPAYTWNKKHVGGLA